jgi:hypothetical protein
MPQEQLDPELHGWDEVEQIAATGNPTSSAKAQAKAARKLTFSIANLRLAVNSHQKITADRMDKLAKSIDKFNDNSGTLARAANWLAGALVILGIAQVVVAIINH